MTRIAIWVAASALALAAAGVAVRAAAIRLDPRDPPLLALTGDAPDRVLATAMAQFLQQRGRIEPDAARAAIAAAAARPLDERPFVVAAVGALSDGREAEAVALLERARRLNPRQRVARLLLMDRYLRTGRVTEATSEIAAVYRLVPNTADALTQELARLLSDPASRAATRAALAGNAELLDAALAILARAGTDPRALAAIAGPGAPAGLTPAGWRSVQVQTLVDQGRYDAARAIWQNAYRVSADDARALPFDPGFSGRARPPFGWELVSGDVGSAERTADGLAIEYFGRRSGSFATQLMVADPGRYRLSYAIEGNDGGEAGSISITVTCAGTPPRLLATLPAPRLAGGGLKRVATELAIPADCPAQWLVIGGTAGEFASATSATLSAVSLARSDR